MTTIQSSSQDNSGLILLMIFIFIIVIIGIAGRNMSQYVQNEKAPILTEKMRVISKRVKVHGTTNRTSTSYFITFESESGNRIELKVMDTQYGLFVESDIGMLTYQGTRFEEFKRITE